MSELSRRRFVGTTGVGVVAASGLPLVAADSTTGAAASPTVAPKTRVKVTVNGALHEAEVEDRWTLVEFLRDHAGLTGTKIGCDRGECGACTVLMNGKAVYSCSQLAVWADGATIQTVEGMASGAKLDPLQEAFIEHDGPQCGFCTSGQLMSAKALLNRNAKPSRDEVRHAMTGNLCRCGNYNHYVESVLAAASRA